MNKHYKIVYGYGEGDYLPITGSELPRAIALFLEANGRGIFENGAVRGQDIMRIVPDWHTVLGVNKGYKLTSDDYARIGSQELAYTRTQQKAKEIAVFALTNDRRDLLTMSPLEAVKALPAVKSLQELAARGK